MTSRAELGEEPLEQPGGPSAGLGGVCAGPCRLRGVCAGPCHLGGVCAGPCGLGGVLREGGDELRDEAETKLLLGCRRC